MHTEARHNGMTMLSGTATADELAALVQAPPDAPPPAPERLAPASAESVDPDAHLEIPGEAEPPKDGFREWIDPETKKNLDLRRKGPRRIKQLWEQNQTLRQQLEEAKRTPPVAAPVTTPPAAPPVAATPSTDAPDPEPDPNDTTRYPDGQFDRKFLKDQARWEVRQELQAQTAKQREAEQSAERRTVAERVTAELQSATQQYETKKVAARAKYPDFDQVMGATQVQTSPVMQHAILTSEHAADLAYFLATHPEDAQTILTETALMDARQMPFVRRTLEALLSRATPAPATVKTPPPAPPRSAAPPPAQPVGGGSSASDTTVDNISVLELAAQLRHEEQTSRRRSLSLA